VIAFISALTRCQMFVVNRQMVLMIWKQNSEKSFHHLTVW